MYIHKTIIKVLINVDIIIKNKALNKNKYHPRRDSLIFHEICFYFSKIPQDHRKLSLSICKYHMLGSSENIFFLYIANIFNFPNVFFYEYFNCNEVSCISFL